MKYVIQRLNNTYIGPDNKFSSSLDDACVFDTHEEAVFAQQCIKYPTFVTEVLIIRRDEANRLLEALGAPKL